MTTRDKIAIGTSAAGVAVVATAAAEVIRRTTGRVILAPREAELGRMLLGLVGYEEYERAVHDHHDEWPGWHDGGMREVKNLYKKLGGR